MEQKPIPPPPSWNPTEEVEVANWAKQQVASIESKTAKKSIAQKSEEEKKVEKAAKQDEDHFAMLCALPSRTWDQQTGA